MPRFGCCFRVAAGSLTCSEVRETNCEPELVPQAFDQHQRFLEVGDGALVIAFGNGDAAELRDTARRAVEVVVFAKEREGGFEALLREGRVALAARTCRAAGECQSTEQGLVRRQLDEPVEYSPALLELSAHEPVPPQRLGDPASELGVAAIRLPR